MEFLKRHFDKIISSIALLVAIYTCVDNKRIERKNDSSISVAELVKYIQTSPIGFVSVYKTSRHQFQATIFQLDTFLITKNNKDSRIFFPYGKKLTTDFENKYEKDAYMPKEIAKALKNFRVEGNCIYIPKRETGYITLTDINAYYETEFSRDTLKPHLISSPAPAYESFENFITKSIELKEIIKKWIRNNNANIQIVED